MKFSKYHALGNDYLVLNPEDGSLPDEQSVRVICHRNFGLGSDGILYGPLSSECAEWKLRIFNPDGSEAEKSGNGLRIFARYLYDTGRATETPFRIETLGGIVSCSIRESGNEIEVEMGQVSFDSARIPVEGPSRSVINETISILGEEYRFCAATVGNPHCVVPLETISAELARRIGPEIERHPLFPRRTNVQLLRVIDRANIQIEIWERGAGYTLASGTSSSAAAAVARRLGLVDHEVVVHMPGGTLQVVIDEAFGIRVKGSATHVGEMVFDATALSAAVI